MSTFFLALLVMGLIGLSFFLFFRGWRKLAVGSSLTALVLSIAMPAFAEIEQYRQPRAAYTIYRSGLSAADPLTGLSPVTTGTITRSSTSSSTVFVVEDNPNLALGARFSDNGATVLVGVCIFNYQSGSLGPVVFVEEVTLTAKTLRETLEADASYHSNKFLFDLGTATHAEVKLLGAPSSGTVDLWKAIYGSDTK